MIGHLDGSYELGAEHVMDLDNPAAAALAEALGLTKRRTKRGRRGGPTCEDCFFHHHMLCALDVDGPCSTFRANGPEGLAPPLQPSLLPRQATEAVAEPA
jgi:hypothetical protein